MKTRPSELAYARFRAYVNCHVCRKSYCRACRWWATRMEDRDMRTIARALGVDCV